MEIKLIKKQLEEKQGQLVETEKETTLKPTNKEKDITMDDKDFYMINAVNELTKAIRQLIMRIK